MIGLSLCKVLSTMKRAEICSHLKGNSYPLGTVPRDGKIFMYCPNCKKNFKREVSTRGYLLYKPLELARSSDSEN